MKKKVKILILSSILSSTMSLPVFAGTWQKEGPTWSYTKDDGNKAVSEWIQDNGKWYHFGSDSIMQTGWVKDGDKFYYLDSTGAMYSNRWVLSGYYVGSDGAWIPDYKPDANKVSYGISDDDDDDNDDDDSQTSVSSSTKHSVSTPYKPSSDLTYVSTSSIGKVSVPDDYSGGSTPEHMAELIPGMTGGPELGSTAD